MNQFHFTDHKVEAPLFGAVIGALIGGGGTLAGMLTVGGMVGAGIGAIGGSLLQKSMTPDLDMPSQAIVQATAPQTPQTPTAPAVPQTPGATPTSPVGSNAPGTPTANPTPTAGTITTPQDGSSPATNEDIAKGEVDVRKRRGRLSTILTSREGREETGGEEVERLGG